MRETSNIVDFLEQLLDDHLEKEDILNSISEHFSGSAHYVYDWRKKHRNEIIKSEYRLTKKNGLDAAEIYKIVSNKVAKALNNNGVNATVSPRIVRHVIEGARCDGN